MKKISFDDWKNSMQFMLDDDFDNRFLQTISPLTDMINNRCLNFGDADFLTEFISNEEPDFTASLKLKALIALIGLSQERLKRVATLVRFKVFGEQFRTEWSINRIVTEIKRNGNFKELLVEFFINGRNSRIGVEVPLYYLRNFKLSSEDFLHELNEFNYVERILNDSEIQGMYSNSVGAHVEKIIQERINNFGIIFEEQKEFPLLNKNIDFLIPSVSDARILIESSYNITTGSGQSKRADQLVDFYSTLMRHNANNRDRKILMLNYCDGFGWVGRQNDLRRIYDASDFVFNQSNLIVLDNVLETHFA